MGACVPFRVKNSDVQAMYWRNSRIVGKQLNVGREWLDVGPNPCVGEQRHNCVYWMLRERIGAQIDFSAFWPAITGPRAGDGLEPRLSRSALSYSFGPLCCFSLTKYSRVRWPRPGAPPRIGPSHLRRAWTPALDVSYELSTVRGQSDH